MNNTLHTAKELREITLKGNRIKEQYELINEIINKVATEQGLFYLCVAVDKNCTTIYPEGQKLIVKLSFSELLDYIPKLNDFGYEVKVYNGYICIFWNNFAQ